MSPSVRPAVRLVLALALSVPASGALPGLAHAGNGAHLRTPVDWSGAPCMTVIDRSRSPIHAFDYAIPYEDTRLTEDEVADSRTHQFLAFCRDRHRDEFPPGWLSELDVEAAIDNGLGEPTDLDLELDVLDNSPIWADCWARITADDARRPITFAAAAQPVVWDTTALPAGTWVIDGYTHEPWFNLWTAHPGVVKIIDDPDPAASGPAASLDGPEQEVEFGESAAITGCVDAMPGTTMRLSWALEVVNSEPQWVEFATDLPAETGAFELPFEPPLETVSNPVLIRLELLDPLGRSWTAYSRNPIGVLDAGVDDEGCEGGFVGGPCGDTGTGTGSGETESGEDRGSSTSSTAPATDGGSGSCACATSPSGGAARGFGWGLVGLLGLSRWRRSRS